MSGGLFDRLRSELEGREKAAGLSMADVLTLPDAERQAVNLMLRRGTVDLADIVARVGQDEASVRSMLDSLVEQGFVQELVIGGVSQFRTRLAAKRGRQVPIDVWKALDERVGGEGR